MTPKIVLLNDTDLAGKHFGCARVMRVIREQLQARGLEPAGSVAVSLNWRDAHRDLVESADIIVINGEGTLHHGSRRGRWLLDAAEAVKARGGKVALINALWQDNPDEWGGLIRNADILACRDSWSAAAMARQTGRTDIRLMGDLSMTQPISDEERHKSGIRAGVVLGDSVHASVTAHLAQVASQIPEAAVVPVTSTLKFVSPHLRGLRRLLRQRYTAMMQRRYLAAHPQARFLPDEAAYIDMLHGKALSVTGRFHAACLAVATGTPFVAVRSNSWKIEALLEDTGLSDARLLPLERVTAEDLDPETWAFSPEEKASMAQALSRWQADAGTLFDDIATLAASPRSSR